MKAAIYARVSTADQHCESQLAELREYVQRRGWDLAAEYVDAGVSGSKASRPALDRMMAAAARHEFDAVLVVKVDRLGRSVLHLSQLLARLNSYGIEFHAISQGLSTGDKSPTGSLLLSILAAVAEFEREMICERTRAGLRAAVARGETLGRPRRIYRRDEAAELRSAGKSWAQISAALGVPVGTLRRGVAENVQ